MKVAINKCYGGFCLSYDAMVWLREHGNEEAKHYPIQEGEFWENEDGTKTPYKSYTIDPKEDSFHLFSDKAERSDPLLIQCIEELGDKVNCWASQIEIVDVPESGWYIDDYDGVETIHMEHSSW